MPNCPDCQRDIALATGDWIAAAMSKVMVGDRTVAFAGKYYLYTRDASGCLYRLDPKIKNAAISFGLSWSQVDRFYGRVSKRVARHIAREKLQKRQLNASNRPF